MTQIIQQTDWTLVTALVMAVTALSAVVVVLWRRYTAACAKVEAELQYQVNELVPLLIKLSEQAAGLHRSSERLIDTAISLQRNAPGSGE